MKRPFSIAITAALLFIVFQPASCDESKPAALQIRVQSDTGDFDLDTQQFTAKGNVRVTYSDTTLIADEVRGSMTTGEVEAIGNVRFEGPDRSLTGGTFQYNYKTRIGLVEHAAAKVDSIIFHGDSLTSEPERYTIKGSTLTTCDKDPPHYYLSCREVVIRPGIDLVARHGALHLLGTRLFSIPRFKASLDRSAHDMIRLPTIGAGSRYGMYLGYEFDISREPGFIGGLDIRLSTAESLQGGLLIDRVANNPVFVRLTHKQPYYGGIRDDLLISRLPEVGVRLCAGEAAKRYESGRDPAVLSMDAFNPLEERRPGSPFNVVAEVGAARFLERPTDVSTERVDVRAVAWLDRMAIDDRTEFSPGIAARYSHYGTGQDYASLGLRLAVARRLGAEKYVSLAYIRNSTSGSTPFSFDQVELREELAGKIGFPLGNSKIELGGRYDLHKGGFFDTEVSVAHRLHCVEPKVTWRSRFNEFSLGLGLVRF